MFRQYADNQRNLSQGDNYPTQSRFEKALRNLNYERFIPKFVNEKNKYIIYIAVLLLFGLLGIFLRRTFELDFSSMTDNTGED